MQETMLKVASMYKVSITGNSCGEEIKEYYKVYG